MLNIKKHFLTVKPARNVVLGSGGIETKILPFEAVWCSARGILKAD